MATTPPLPKQDAAAPASFMRNDFPFIRRATFLFVLSAVLAAALAGGTAFLNRARQEAKNRAQQQRNEAFARYQQAGTEKREVYEFQPQFVLLRQRGFVGDERRLDWIEYLKASQEKRQLLPMTYEIANQQPFQVDPAVSTGTLQLRGSKMTLRLKLWHEGDLLQLLADLKQSGFYAPAECTIVRGATATEAFSPPELEAECKLYWLTLGAAAATEAEQGKPPAQ